MVVWPDADHAGHQAAQEVAWQCQQAGARSVDVVTPPPDVPDGWDLADAEADGWTGDHLQEWINEHSKTKEQRKTGFQLIRVSDLECKAPDWLVQDYLETDSLAVAFGDPASGKSFMGIGIGCCIATELNFYGLPTKHGPVIYIAGEARNGIARRLKVWEIRNSTDLSTAPLYLSNGPTALCDPESSDQILTAVDQADVHPHLVVIDTLARNFGPGDENSTKDMTAAIQAMDAIRTRYRCTVLMIHHTGHGEKNRARGAMALKGALDSEYRLDKDEDGIVRLTPVKMKEAELPEPMAFELRTVELGFQDENGREVTSAILDRVGYEPPPRTSQRRRGKWQQVALDILKRLIQEHRDRLERGGFDPDQARVKVDEWRDACHKNGMPKQRWYDIKKALKDAGLVRIDQGFVSGSESPVR